MVGNANRCISCNTLGLGGGIDLQKERMRLTVMELKAVKTLTDIKRGDTLIITGDTLHNEPVKAQQVKITPVDGTEIIFDEKANRFFNLGMYLEGKSWVKECKIIT